MIFVYCLLIVINKTNSKEVEKTNEEGILYKNSNKLYSGKNGMILFNVFILSI